MGEGGFFVLAVVLPCNLDAFFVRFEDGRGLPLSPAFGLSTGMAYLFPFLRRNKMADEFKPGDVVELKSGGPRMTVIRIGPVTMGGTKHEVWCEWFDGNKKSRDHFTRESLQISSDPRAR
jgi:uncharacterized protein YodC (DUF2158 family)